MKKLLLFAAVAAFSTVFAQEFPTPGKDTAEYEIEGATFQNEWVYAVGMFEENNFTPAPFGTGGNTRGLAVVQTGEDILSAKVILPRRTNEVKIVDATDTTKAIKKDYKLELIVLNGIGGEIETIIELPDHAFTFEDGDTLRQRSYPMQDLHNDDAGNIVIANMVTSYGNTLETSKLSIWGIDIDWENKTASVEELFSFGEELSDGTLRIDYVGVCGDLKNNGIVMAVNSTNLKVLKLTVTDGAAPEESEWIELQETFPNSVTSLSSAGRVWPISEEYFYTATGNTWPTLYDQDGNYVDGFKDAEGALKEHIAGADLGMNGANEIAIGSDTYMIHGYENFDTNRKRHSNVGIVKLDIAGTLGGTQPVVIFPKNGYNENQKGRYPNGERNVISRVIVDNGTAYIWNYFGANGLSLYTFTPEQTAVKNIESNTLKAVAGNGKITLSEEVANVEVYSVLGQKVAEAHNTNVVEVAAKGVFVVKAGNMSQKVVLK